MRFVVLSSPISREYTVATSPTTHWEARPLPTEDLARLLSWLFSPVADAPEGVQSA